MGKLGTQAISVKTNRGSPWKNREDRDQEHAEKRLAVLTTAANLFVTNGFHRTTLSDVAAQLNITKPAIYHYFRSKDEILAECTRSALEACEEFFAKEDDPARPGVQRLERFMTWYAESMTTPFGMCLVRIAEQDVDADAQKQLLAAERVIFRRFRQLLETGINDGSVADCDANVAAFTIAGALSWLGHWYRPGGRLTAKEAAKRASSLLLRGLLPRAPGV